MTTDHCCHKSQQTYSLFISRDQGRGRGHYDLSLFTVWVIIDLNSWLSCYLVVLPHQMRVLYNRGVWRVISVVPTEIYAPCFWGPYLCLFKPLVCSWSLTWLDNQLLCLRNSCIQLNRRASISVRPTPKLSTYEGYKVYIPLLIL